MPVSKSDKIIGEVIRVVESNRRSEIRLSANGGNAVLVVCDPKEEQSYISSVKELLQPDNFEIIDLNEVLTSFANTNKGYLEERFELLQSSLDQVFKFSTSEDEGDLFQLIISNIKEAFSVSKIPVLVNTGTLYGTGIDNIHIMENDAIMNSSFPLVVLYPATHKDEDNLLFLGKRTASKYRCMIIE